MCSIYTLNPESNPNARMLQRIHLIDYAPRQISARIVGTSRLVLPHTTCLSLRGAVCISLVFVVLILTYTSYGQQGTLHPTPVNIPSADNVDYAISLPELAAENPKIYSVDTPISQIGENEGRDYEMIGDIRDLELDFGGNVLVLDSEYNTVRVYDYSGEYQMSFGKPGDGPGELRNVWDLSIGDDGQTVTVSGGSRDVVIYRLNQSDLTYSYYGSIRKLAPGNKGCYMNGHVYTLTYGPGFSGVIHKYTLDGEFVTSFGSPYVDDNEYVVSNLSDRGMLVCSEPHGVVGLVREYLPTLMGYSEQGDLLWTVLFSDFEPAVVEELVSDGGRPSLLYTVPSIGQSWFANMFSDVDGTIYVSYTVNLEDESTPTYLFKVDPSSGEGRYVGDGNGVLAVDGRYVMYRTVDRFPRIGIAYRNNME